MCCFTFRSKESSSIKIGPSTPASKYWAKKRRQNPYSLPFCPFLRLLLAQCSGPCQQAGTRQLLEVTVEILLKYLVPQVYKILVWYGQSPREVTAYSIMLCRLGMSHVTSLKTVWNQLTPSLIFSSPTILQWWELLTCQKIKDCHAWRNEDSLLLLIDLDCV